GCTRTGPGRDTQTSSAGRRRSRVASSTLTSDYHTNERGKDRMNEDAMTPEEVAERLGRSKAWVLDAARKGIIHCMKIGHRTIRFRWFSILSALEALSDHSRKGKQGSRTPK